VCEKYWKNDGRHRHRVDKGKDDVGGEE